MGFTQSFWQTTKRRLFSYKICFDVVLFMVAQELKFSLKNLGKKLKKNQSKGLLYKSSPHHLRYILQEYQIFIS